MAALPDRHDDAHDEGPDQPALRLRLVGPFTVYRAGRLVPARDVGSRKARTLLALLAVERGRLVGMDRIVEALWPDDRPRHPAENVATLVSRLRTVLGRDTVIGGRPGYRLGGAVATDVRDAGALVSEAESRLATGEPSLALVAAEQTLHLLGDDVVLADEPDAPWAEPARAQYSDLLCRARHTAAEAALRTGDLPAATSAADAAVSADPLDEVGYRLLMRAYDAAGEPARALAVYERARATLAEELGAHPAPATRELHVAILRGTQPPLRSVVASRVPRVLAQVRPGERQPRVSMLAGRDREMARLSAAWARVAAGEPHVLLITGEAGIGKTRLADEGVRLARDTGGLVAQVRCFAAERSLFLQPVVDALTRLVAGLPARTVRAAAGDRAGALAALIPDADMLLGSAPADHGSADAERRRSFDAVAVFLRRLSTDRPVLLLLDDLHNAGAATVELLHYLPRHVAGARLLVLTTVRAEEGEQALDALAGVTERIEVGPLDTQAIAQLATSVGQDALVGQIERRTRGHTLFVVETLRGLAAGVPGVPDSLRATVLARVRSAGPEAEELLRAAAVLGPSFAPATVAGLLDLTTEEAARRCERILPSRLTVVAGQAYEFANDLIQEVLYATTPEPTRTAYHWRAADLLAGNPEAVAGHAAAAGDWSRAARGWLGAGERAMRRYAARDAETMLNRALDAARRADDRELQGRVHLARGRAREAGFSYEEALADHEAAVELARTVGDQRLEMSALRELGGPAWAGVGRPVADGVAHLRRGLRLAELLGDRGAQSQLMGWLAVVACSRLAFDEGVAYGQRALVAAGASGDERAMATALDGLKTAYAYLGELTELGRVLDELEPLARRLGDLWLVQWCVFESGFPLIGAGDWAGAAARVTEALAISRRSGYTGYESWYLAHLGWLARLDGRYDEAIEYGRRALRTDSHSWWHAAAPAMLATTLLAAGEPAEAIALLETGLAVCDRHRTEAYRLRCLAPLAEATGSPRLLREADAMVRAIRTPPGGAWLYGADSYVAVARAWLARGEPGQAVEILAPLVAAADRTGWTAPIADARALLDQAQSSSASSSAARAAPPLSTGR